MKKEETTKEIYWIFLLLLFALHPSHMVWGMDSTVITGTSEIPIPPVISILGSVENNKLCSYKSIDSKVHCQSSQEGGKEFMVTQIRSPTFPRFQSPKIGNITIQNNTVYGFISPLVYKKEGSDFTICKLSLEFKPKGKPVVWIWFDEIRFDGENHRAFIDSNGDGFIDRTLVGKWNGNLYGSRKWWTPDPLDGVYTAEEREYTNRPGFETINGKLRGCSVEKVKVATLSAIN